MLSLVRGGLEDFSVSRPRRRSHGWGIPVPDDPSQVVYVWFDALANYLTSLGYGAEGDPYRTWWGEADERVHVIGKGIVRFHAVYWPAILLSAGVPLPTAVFVHDYVTAGGRRLSKSSEARLDPFDLASRYGVDALRWWCVRDVPRSGDVDFREELLAARADELANQLGNLVARTVALVARSRPDRLDRGAPPRAAAELVARIEQAPAAIDAALERFDLRTAAGAAWEIVTEANRLVASARPWDLARRERATGSRAATSTPSSPFSFVPARRPPMSSAPSSLQVPTASSEPSRLSIRSWHARSSRKRHTLGTKTAHSRDGSSASLDV